MRKNHCFESFRLEKKMAAAVLNVWPLSNYGFGSKAPESPVRDRSEAARLERLRAR